VDLTDQATAMYQIQMSHSKVAPLRKEGSWQHEKTRLRFTVVQELEQQDYDKRMTYCRWFQTFIDENPGILDYTWFSDEAWFHLSGYVNSQNTSLWGSENPHALLEEPFHSQKVSVFCALSQRRIIGPMFFDTTVTSEVYAELFREFVNQLDDRNSHLVITNKIGPQATLLA
jgi:hypothetical protein